MKKVLTIYVSIFFAALLFVFIEHQFQPTDINIDCSGVKLTVSNNSYMTNNEILNVKINGKLVRSINKHSSNFSDFIDTWFVGDIIIDNFSTYKNCTIRFNGGIGHFSSSNKKNSVEPNNTIAIYAKSMLTYGYLVQTTGNVKRVGDLLLIWPATSLNEALKVKEICDDLNLSIWQRLPLPNITQ